MGFGQGWDFGLLLFGEIDKGVFHGSIQTDHEVASETGMRLAPKTTGVRRPLFYGAKRMDEVATVKQGLISLRKD